MNVEYSKRPICAKLQPIMPVPTMRVLERRSRPAFVSSSHALPKRRNVAVRVAQRPGVRVMLLVRYRYKIFYRVVGTTVRIIHIRHMSRRPWPPG